MGKKAKAAKSSGGGGSKKAGGGLFLEKGEKILIAVGGAGLALLLVWGVMSFAAADSPEKIVGDLKSQARNVQASITSDGNGAPKLPEWVEKETGGKTVPADYFALTGTVFEPLYKPDSLRENPRVLPIVAFQVDPVRGPMRSLDIQPPAAEGGDWTVGVQTDKEVAAKDKSSYQKAFAGLRSTLRAATPQKTKKTPRPVRPPPRGQPGVTETVGPAGDPYGIGGGYGETPVDGQRDEKSILYLTPREVAEGKYPLAETVYPFRAILLQAGFPLKAQIEEIKRAMRVQMSRNPTGAGGTGPMAGDFGPDGVGATGPVAGAIYAPAPPTGPGGPGRPPFGVRTPGQEQPKPTMLLGPGFDPVFVGINVEKRTITPTGEDLGWAPYDHESEYFSKIRSRTVANEPDNGYLPYLLRYEQRLAAPLPQFVEGLGNYPKLRMAPVLDVIDKLQDANRPVQTETDFQKRFNGNTGDLNPYAPTAGLFSSTEPPGGESALPRPGVGPQPGPGGNGYEDAYGVAKAPEIDVLLLRFFDVEVLPGYSYQYRIQVVMRNPNFGAEKAVREPSDAKKETLVGPWVEVPEIVTYPAEAHLYAYNTAEYAEEAESEAKDLASGDKIAYSILSALFGGRDVKAGKEAVVQMQTWMPQVRASGNAVEPVGTWVVTEIPVTPGEYVGRRQIVKLPLWSSAVGGYVLRKLANAVDVQGLQPANQPKGWAVNFGTKSVLVDFAGGSIREEIDGTRVEDTSASELLILRPDGKLMIRNSAVDMADPKRKQRDDEWTAWLARVKTKPVDPNDPMAGDNGFGFGRQ